MARVYWTPAEDAELVRLRAAGVTGQQMAVRLGRTRHAIISRIALLGLPPLARVNARRKRQAEARAQREAAREAKQAAAEAAKAAKAKPPVPRFQPKATVVPVYGVMPTAEAVRRAEVRDAAAKDARDARRAQLAAKCRGEQKVRECRVCEALFVSDHAGHRVCCTGHFGVTTHSLAGVSFR